MESETAYKDINKDLLFNKYFHSVFNSSSSPLHIIDFFDGAYDYSHLEISNQEVFEALSSLDPTKAMGIDGISSRFLKNCAIALYEPLHHLFTISL